MKAGSPSCVRARARRPRGHKTLNLARLPVPPLRRPRAIIIITQSKSMATSQSADEWNYEIRWLPANAFCYYFHGDEIMSLMVEAEPVPLKFDHRGVARVGGTRVTLQSLIAYYLQGYSAEDLARAFPSVKLEDIYATLSYFLRHRQEVERYMDDQQAK